MTKKRNLYKGLSLEKWQGNHGVSQQNKMARNINTLLFAIIIIVTVLITINSAVAISNHNQQRTESNNYHHITNESSIKTTNFVTTLQKTLERDEP